MTHKIGYLVGSLAKGSINRTLSQALIKVAPDDLEFTEIPIGNLPLYSWDYDDDFPPEGRAFKQAVEASDGILFVSPEYNRSIPGALKNAIDWGSRPWGSNSFARKPTGIIGASPGGIGTAVMQSSMRAVLSFLDAPATQRPRGLHPVRPGGLRRRRRGAQRGDRRLPAALHGRVLRLRPARARRQRSRAHRRRGPRVGQVTTARPRRRPSRRPPRRSACRRCRTRSCARPSTGRRARLRPPRRRPRDSPRRRRPGRPRCGRSARPG